jgi:coniferyl-aldehyde dehydrogenase
MTISNEDDIEFRLKGTLSRQQKAFAEEPMPSLESRKVHLQTLKGLLLKHQEAISADFSARSRQETRIVEIMPCIEHIGYVTKHLRRWMRPSRRDVGLHFQPARAKVVYGDAGVFVELG